MLTLNTALLSGFRLQGHILIEAVDDPARQQLPFGSHQRLQDDGNVLARHGHSRDAAQMTRALAVARGQNISNQRRQQHARGARPSVVGALGDEEGRHHGAIGWHVFVAPNEVQRIISMRLGSARPEKKNLHALVAQVARQNIEILALGVPEDE